MPESPRDLRTLHAARVDTANEAIRQHARDTSDWSDLAQARHTLLVGEWQQAVAELQAAEDDEARPAAA